MKSIRHIERGGRKYKVIIESGEGDLVRIWFMDITGEQFTRFAVQVHKDQLKTRLAELVEQLGRETKGDM